MSKSSSNKWLALGLGRLAGEIIRVGTDWRVAMSSRPPGHPTHWSISTQVVLPTARPPVPGPPVGPQRSSCSSTALISNLHSSLEIQKFFGPSHIKTNHLSMTPIQGKLKCRRARLAARLKNHDLNAIDASLWRGSPLVCQRELLPLGARGNQGQQGFKDAPRVEATRVRTASVFEPHRHGSLRFRAAPLRDGAAARHTVLHGSDVGVCDGCSRTVL